MEHGIQTLGQLCLVVFQTGESRLLQHQDGTDVEPGHQADPDVTQAPGQIGGLDGAVDGGSHQRNLQQEGEPGAVNLAVDKSDVGFGDVVVGHDGGEGEEEQGDGDEVVAKAWHHALHGGLHIAGACRDAGDAGVEGGTVRPLHVVQASDEQHEAGGGADEQGVDIDGERLHQALLGRVAHRRGGGGVGASPLGGFVGVDPALDTPHDGQTQNGAEAGFHPEGTLPDEQDHARQLADVQGDDDAGHDDVTQRHEGHHGTGEIGDAFDAAEDDETEQQRQTGGGHVGVDGKGGLQAGADGVCLHARQQYAAGEDGGDGEGPGIPLHAQALLDVEGRTAAIFTVDLLLVDLAQGGLHEGGAGAKEGDHPHPEQGARAAEGDGSGHTGDVAGTDATGQGHGECLEGGDTGIVALALKHQAYHAFQVAQLQETAAQGEVEAYPQTQIDERWAPNHAIDGIDDLIHVQQLLCCAVLARSICLAPLTLKYAVTKGVTQDCAGLSTG